jgi:hypothetical protein
MKATLYSIMLLAGCGLVLSIGAHCMAIFGTTIPGGKLVWCLHVGVLVVWIPTVFISAQTTRHTNRKDFWKVALAGCPNWVLRGLYVLFGYAVLNFVVFMAATISQPKQRTGESSSFVVRGFSGHWMVFYGAAFAVLSFRIHAPQLYRERKCPQGHDVSPAARFCSDCGYDFSDDTGNARR